MSLLILNFHGVGSIPRAVDGGEYNCWLDQNVFEAILDLIGNQRNIRLTVDDGNASDHEIILPALRQRNLQATFFICAGRIDQPTFLSRKQVHEIQAQGMTIGSHGIDHVPWRGLPRDQLLQETIESRRILEEICGPPIDAAACPFGSYDFRVVSTLRRAGYRAVYTSDGGGAKDSQWLRARTTINRTTGLNDIANLVRCGPGALRQSLISLRTLAKRMRP